MRVSAADRRNYSVSWALIMIQQHFSECWNQEKAIRHEPPTGLCTVPQITANRSFARHALYMLMLAKSQAFPTKTKHKDF